MQNQHLMAVREYRKYRIELPNLLDDSELDVYEFRLLTHYIRRGNCYESVRTTAEHCHMSHTTVIRARKMLEEKGYIRTRKLEQGTIGVQVVDRWEENYQHFSRRKKEAQAGSLVEQDGSQNEQSGSTVELNGTEMEPKKEPFKQKKKKEKPIKQAGSSEQMQAAAEIETAASAAGGSFSPVPQTLLEARTHPDIQLFYRVSGRLPARQDLGLVLETFSLLRSLGKNLQPVLAECWQIWCSRGYSPSNLAWLTDWAVNGISQPPKRAKITHQQREYRSPYRLTSPEPLPQAMPADGADAPGDEAVHFWLTCLREEGDTCRLPVYLLENTSPARQQALETALCRLEAQGVRIARDPHNLRLACSAGVLKQALMDARTCNSPEQGRPSGRNLTA